MSVESAAPPNARAVYTLLIATGVIAALTVAIVISVIVFNYVTRSELRDPDNAPLSHASVSGVSGGPAGLNLLQAPSWKTEA